VGVGVKEQKEKRKREASIDTQCTATGTGVSARIRGPHGIPQRHAMFQERKAPAMNSNKKLQQVLHLRSD